MVKGRLDKGFSSVFNTKYPLPYFVRLSIWFVETLLFFDWRWARNRVVMLLKWEKKPW